MAVAVGQVGAVQGDRRASRVDGTGLFAWAVEEELVGWTPARRLVSPKRGRTLPRRDHRPLDDVLTAAAERAASGDAVALRDHALLEVLYGSGARVSEVCGLDLDDIDHDRRTLFLRGKGGKDRVVPFGLPAARALQAYLVRARPVLQARRVEASASLASGSRHDGSGSAPAFRPRSRGCDAPARARRVPGGEGLASRAERRAHALVSRPWRRVWERTCSGRTLCRHSAATHCSTGAPICAPCRRSSPRESGHHADLHPCLRRAPPRGLPTRAPARLRGRRGRPGGAAPRARSPSWPALRQTPSPSVLDRAAREVSRMRAHARRTPSVEP